MNKSTETTRLDNGGTRSILVHEGSTPVPDPTLLTTQQLHRELTSLRELIETRLEGYDKAITLLQSTLDKSPSIAEMYASHGEKFHSIQTQFTERDIRTEQTARDSKVAVDAALQAAKEAVGEQNKSSALAIAKSETSTTKQIDQISVLIDNTRKSFDDKIDDIKQRLTSMEGMRKGGSDVWAYVFGIAGFLTGIASILALILKH
jgi:hypothetical protein